MSQTLVLNSRKRLNNESVNRITYNISMLARNIKDLRIHEFILRNKLYSINQYNGNFIMTYSGTNYAIALTQGYYDSPSQLTTEVATRLNACGSGLTFACSSDPVSYKVTISTTNNFTLTFNDVSAGWLLGYTASSYTGASTYTSEQSYDLVYTDYVEINIVDFCKLEASIRKESGWEITYSNHDLNLLNSPKTNVTYMVVELRDEYGRLLLTNDDYLLRLELK